MPLEKQRKLKKLYPADGYNFVSLEELHFYYWLQEAIKLNLFSPNFTYQPEPFILTDPVKLDDIKFKNGKGKLVQVSLLKAHTYQPDFHLHLGENFYRLPHGLTILIDGLIIASLDYIKDHYKKLSIYVDVKGSFNQNDAYRRFSIDQKLMYEKHKILVYKIIPQQFFLKTWCPALCLYQKRDPTKRVMAYEKCKTLAERLKEKNYFISQTNLTNSQTSIKFE